MKRTAALYLIAMIGLVSFWPARISRADTPSSPGETINTLDYFVSKHLDKSLGGSHNQNQVIEGNISYYVKWAANAYEVHAWDDSYIYLREDHSWGYEQGYAFRPGRWMKRAMQVGESITEPANQGYYFSNGSCTLANITALPYVMTLEDRVADYDIGGDLGRQDIIILKYDYSTAAHPGSFERFYYSKEWGWVKWELYQQGALVQTSIFNKINNIDKPTLPDKNVSCTHGGLVAEGFDPVVYQLPLFKILTGKVVRAEGSTALYYINGQGQREYICDPKLLAEYNVAPADIESISDDDLAAYPLLSYVRLSSGSIYKLDGAKKRLVKASAFAKNNIDPATVHIVDRQSLSCYRTGPAIR